jgi:hypothetical protein
MPLGLQADEARKLAHEGCKGISPMHTGSLLLLGDKHSVPESLSE